MRGSTAPDCTCGTFPDTSDFRLVAHDRPPPDWPLDTVVYQVFPDRFAKSLPLGAGG